LTWIFFEGKGIDSVKMGGGGGGGGGAPPRGGRSQGEC